MGPAGRLLGDYGGDSMGRVGRVLLRSLRLIKPISPMEWFLSVAITGWVFALLFVLWEAYKF